MGWLDSVLAADRSGANPETLAGLRRPVSGRKDLSCAVRDQDFESMGSTDR